MQVAKDHYELAAIPEQYPKMHLTYDLRPVPILRLDDLAAGGKDTYWLLAEKPADPLNDGDWRFILRRFFNAN